MSSGNGNVNDNRAPGPEADWDEALKREVEAALGDINLEQLIDSEQKPREPSESGVRRGKVIAIQGDDIFVDMGGKSQGILPAAQFKEEPMPSEGDVIEVTIEGYDQRDGLLLLSRLGAITAAAWETLAEGQAVEGRVTGHNKGGLELDINGIRAFMPVSHISLARVEDLAPYVDQRLRCEVIDIDEADENVVVSCRALLERESAETREQTFASLEEGQTVSGTVRNIMPYGAFVDIGGVDGLLHVREMSYGRVEDPKTVVQEGQQVEVMVLKIDRDERKVSLGLKQVMPDPWMGAEGKWPVDEVVTVRVTSLVDFGAFAELADGVEGLIPISEMSFERRINHPKELVSVGQVVKVRVLGVDSEKRRIGLSLKRVGDDPWMGASVRWPADSVAQGTVKRVTDFGAFVELGPGVEGLVHISELGPERVQRVTDVVHEGDMVEAKVLSVDEDRRRIALSIKQLASMPDYTGPDAAEPEAPTETTKRKRPLRGGLD
jgi:small subunit ribosomal protein S1